MWDGSDSVLEGLRVLVTGAEERQGLAVIRGLGRAGAHVIAAGIGDRGLGHRSRYAKVRASYPAPHRDPEAFLQTLLTIAARERADLIMPVVESTLVAIENGRAAVESVAPVAAPTGAVLQVALDKGCTLALAERVRVSVPRTIRVENPRTLLPAAATLGFPVAIKPRGPRQYGPTAHRAAFKVRYAHSPADLEWLVGTLPHSIGPLLVQELVPGTARCVAAVCRHGEILACVPYERVRELPLSGGVSVMRRTIAPNRHLLGLVGRLLAAAHWHGVAMVEFKYDAARDHYTLMEINGRFQASTALALDAGCNLPAWTAALYTGRPLPRGAVTTGVEERWLRGDLRALGQRLRAGPAALPSRTAALRHFLRDFRPGVHHDEFARDDWRPAFTELRALARATWEEGRWCLGELARRLTRAHAPSAHPARASGSAIDPDRQAASTTAHRAIRW